MPSPLVCPLKEFNMESCFSVVFAVFYESVTTAVSLDDQIIQKVVKELIIIGHLLYNSREIVPPKFLPECSVHTH